MALLLPLPRSSLPPYVRTPSASRWAARNHDDPPRGIVLRAGGGEVVGASGGSTAPDAMVTTASAAARGGGVGLRGITSASDIHSTFRSIDIPSLYPTTPPASISVTIVCIATITCQSIPLSIGPVPAPASIPIRVHVTEVHAVPSGDIAGLKLVCNRVVAITITIPTALVPFPTAAPPLSPRTSILTGHGHHHRARATAGRADCKPTARAASAPGWVCEAHGNQAAAMRWGVIPNPVTVRAPTPHSLRAKRATITQGGASGSGGPRPWEGGTCPRPAEVARVPWRLVAPVLGVSTVTDVLAHLPTPVSGRAAVAFAVVAIGSVHHSADLVNSVETPEDVVAAYLVHARLTHATSTRAEAGIAMISINISDEATSSAQRRPSGSKSSETKIPAARAWLLHACGSDCSRGVAARSISAVRPDDLPALWQAAVTACGGRRRPSEDRPHAEDAHDEKGAARVAPASQRPPAIGPPI